MHVSIEKLTIALLLCSTLSGCDKRSAEEKGKDYADEKLGFVEGASRQLAKRGKGIGTSVGKGLGDLVKGTGSAVKDVTHPPIEVTIIGDLKTSGLVITQATEGQDSHEGREVIIHLRAQKAFKGTLLLNAHAQGKQAARANLPLALDLVADATHVAKFVFDSSVRLSQIDNFELARAEEIAIKVDPLVEAQKIDFSQLSQKTNETGHDVTLYAVFSQRFDQGLTLRGYDKEGKELSRSQPAPRLKQGADSAAFISFHFDARMPLSRIATYEVFVDTAAK